MGKSFKVKIQDLTKGSNVQVDVKCDKCSTIVKVPYGSYNKPIICLTTNKYFDSITDGAKYYSVYFTGVAACCQKRCKSAGKLPDGTRLKWMYYSEFKQFTEEEQNNLLNLYKE